MCVIVLMFIVRIFLRVVNNLFFFLLGLIINLKYLLLNVFDILSKKFWFGLIMLIIVSVFLNILVVKEGLSIE